MFITAALATGYNEKMELDTWSKRTQTKPILPAYVAGKIALSEVEPSCPERSRGIYQNNYPPPAEIAYSS
jgi:hypothetical protein